MYFWPVRSARREVTILASVSFWCSAVKSVPARKKEMMQLPVSGGARADLGAGHAPQERSALADVLRPSFRRQPRDGYFLRAEFQAHFASLLDARAADPEFGRDPYTLYGGKSLHSRSHGEAFLAVIQSRFEEGLFLLDEPEAALSPQRQLVLLAQMHALVEAGSAQFLIATHSPILMTYPDAELVSFDDPALPSVNLEDTSHFQITRGMLENPEGELGRVAVLQNIDPERLQRGTVS